MVNKYLYFYIGIALMSFSNLCNAVDITGVYKGPDSWVVELKSGNASRYEFIYGDIIEGTENCENSKFSICLLFNFVDILIPAKLTVGVKYEYLGSTVNINKHLVEVDFGNTRFNDVYELIVTRSGSLYFDGQHKKRPGGEKVFELLYSKQNGLIGFKEQKNERKDFFLIDWRSLEKRVTDKES